MKLVRNLVVVLGVLIGLGLAKAPFDASFAKELRDEGLLREPLDLDTREQLGQTLAVIALSGTRTLVASLLNIRAFSYFEDQDWYELEKTYDLIAILQPRNDYYWETAAWHLASNAFADHLSRPEYSEEMMLEETARCFERGVEFLEQGLRNNPKSARLWKALGDTLSQTYRPTDFARAAEAYRKAYELSGNPGEQRLLLRSLMRIPGRDVEAWQVMREVWANPVNRRSPTTRSSYFVLQNRVDAGPPDRLTLEQIFGTRERALLNLSTYWFRQEIPPHQLEERIEGLDPTEKYLQRLVHQSESFPVDGVREAIAALCEEFEVPYELNPLRFEPHDQFYDRIHERQTVWRQYWRAYLLPELRQYLNARLEEVGEQSQ